MAGLFAGVLRAGIPVWTDTHAVAVAERRWTGDRGHRGSRRPGGVDHHPVRGVVLATGGFDHSMDMRWKFQSESLGRQPEPGRRIQYWRRGSARGQELGAGQPI